MDKLTNQEEEIMLLFWEIGDGCVKDIQDKIQEPKPPYTTLASIVKNLEKKGYLVSRKIGNVFLYKPVLNSHQYQKQNITGVVKNYFKNSYKEMVTFFAEEQQISSEELKEIIDLIESQSKKEK